MVWDVFNTVATNAGSEFGIIIILIAFFGGLIFYSKGFQVGTTVNMIIFAGIFIWFYESRLNFVLPLIIFMMHLVILALSLYFISKTSVQGGFV